MALLQTGLMIQTPGGSVHEQLAALSRVAQTLEQCPAQSFTSHLHPLHIFNSKSQHQIVGADDAHVQNDKVGQNLFGQHSCLTLSAVRSRA